MTTVGAASTTPAARRISSLLELGKFRIVELWLGFFVSVSLLPIAIASELSSFAILALILAVGIAVIAATCSLDDIVGVRDGVDQANHLQGSRWGVNKPILAGEVSEGQAFRFVYLLGAVIALGLAAVVALAWPLPLWIVAVIGFCMLIPLNYSYGLKLSYRGAGELVIAIGAAGTVLIPFALVAHDVSGLLVVESILVGFWHAQVVVFSNSKDAAGDRATSRMTVAARTSEFGNRVYICGVFAGSFAIGITALVTQIVPVSYLAVLCLLWGLQAYQLWLGVGRRRWLDARRMGFLVIRVGVVALVLANLLLRSAL